MNLMFVTFISGPFAIENLCSCFEQTKQKKLLSVVEREKNYFRVLENLWRSSNLKRGHKKKITTTTTMTKKTSIKILCVKMELVFVRMRYSIKRAQYVSIRLRPSLSPIRIFNTISKVTLSSYEAHTSFIHHIFIRLVEERHQRKVILILSADRHRIASVMLMLICFQ